VCRCVPELQLHSPPVQKDGGGFIVNTWTMRGGRERERERERKERERERQGYDASQTRRA